MQQANINRARIVYFGPALQHFFNKGYFGPLDEDNLDTNMMDYLTLVKQGFSLNDTLPLLFFIYQRANDLTTTNQVRMPQMTFDNLMTQAFDGTIPALNFLYRDQYEKVHKMLMTEAVNRGIIDRPLNTREVLIHVYPNNGIPSRDTPFAPSMITPMTNANIYSINHLDPEIQNFLKNNDTIQQLQNEHDTIFNIYKLWHEKKLILQGEENRPIVRSSIKGTHRLIY